MHHSLINEWVMSNCTYHVPWSHLLEEREHMKVWAWAPGKTTMVAVVLSTTAATLARLSDAQVILFYLS